MSKMTTVSVDEANVRIRLGFKSDLDNLFPRWHERLIKHKGSHPKVIKELKVLLRKATPDTRVMLRSDLKFAKIQKKLTEYPY